MLPESVEEVFETVQNKMDSTVENLRRELSGIHAGRVTPSLLESVKVDYYGNPTPIPQVSNVSAPEPQMLVISPWEKSMLKEVERALQGANLGMSLSNDGNIIRATMPPLTEERRKERVKQVKKLAEDAKVAVRNVRRDGNDTLKKMEKEKLISQDEEKGAQTEVQQATDEHVAQIDALVDSKEQELMND
ncbi:MAG: ribosome recycling factor [bacterium]|jgi:ribosome recycling factor